MHAGVALLDSEGEAELKILEDDRLVLVTDVEEKGVAVGWVFLGGFTNARAETRGRSGLPGDDVLTLAKATSAAIIASRSQLCSSQALSHISEVVSIDFLCGMTPALCCPTSCKRGSRNFLIHAPSARRSWAISMKTRR